MCSLESHIARPPLTMRHTESAPQGPRHTMSDSEKVEPEKGGKKKAEAELPPSLPWSLSQLVGVHVAALALATTYVVGTLSGVTMLTALLRALVVGLVFFILGRVGGFLLGRIVERHLQPDQATQGEVTR